MKGCCFLQPPFFVSSTCSNSSHSFSNHPHSNHFLAISRFSTQANTFFLCTYYTLQNILFLFEQFATYKFKYKPNSIKSNFEVTVSHILDTKIPYPLVSHCHLQKIFLCKICFSLNVIHNFRA